MLNQLNIANILKEIETHCSKYYGQGNVADYIPKLGKQDPKNFALTIVDNEQNIYSIGDDLIEFSIQSVSKVLTLTMALNEFGEEIWGRMEREPSGKAFDSLIHLEEHQGIPSNPFLNSGAIVVADILLSKYGDMAFEKYRLLISDLAGRDLILDRDVYLSEKETGHKNYSFCSYMKSYGNIENPVDEVCDLYFKFCSLKVNNLDLAKIFFYLSNKGISLNNKRITTHRHCKRINSLMFTCGTYNEVGDFAYLVGLPVKSGVSGAIAGCLPGNYSVSVWSPELNKKGNSYLGFKALEMLTTLMDKSYLS